MKRYICATLLVFCLMLLVDQTFSLAVTDDNVETKGQIVKLKYKLKLGWFSIGSGDLSINEHFSFNGEDCYKINAYTETIGLGSWLGSLDDDYTSVINKRMMKPVFNEKHVVSSGSTWDQWMSFDYDSMKVKVKVLDHKRDDPNRNWEVELKKNTQDILGTFMYYKEFDWFKMNRGDSVMINTLYEKKLYIIGMQYMGQEIIEYNDKDVGVYKLHLLYPAHKNIKKDRPIVVYLTSDANQYPILIETKLPFLGKARVELVEINGQEPNL